LSEDVLAEMRDLLDRRLRDNGNSDLN